MDAFIGIVMPILLGCALCFWVGTRLEAQKWRSTGDHEYMNRVESRGRLYQVKREEPNAP